MNVFAATNVPLALPRSSDPPLGGLACGGPAGISSPPGTGRGPGPASGRVRETHSPAAPPPAAAPRQVQCHASADGQEISRRHLLSLGVAVSMPAGEAGGS